MRKRAVLMLSAIVVFSMVAMARDKSLSDRQLAAVTAGSGFGASGVVALPGSNVTTDTEATVTLSDSVMENAKGVTIANTVGGALAVGVNVWDGSTATPSDDPRHNKGVKQINILSNFMPAAEGAQLDGYSSNGSLFLKNPSVSVSAKFLAADAGFVHASDFTVSNTFDQFLGLQAAGSVGANLDDPSFKAKGEICVICNTFDKFKLSDKEFTAAWADIEKASLDVKASADEVRWRGPISFDDAYAEYIVAEDAKLDAKDISSVAMSGNALQGASAVYIVNSANSLVGVGVNVASTSSGLSKQLNVITNSASPVVVGSGH